MKVRRMKYAFYALSLLLLVVMLMLSDRSGVNCDEVLHYNQSVAVCNYFSTGGADWSALETGSTHLKYYGQSYDNISTCLIRIFNIDDIYSFRHIMSTIAGWLLVVVSAFLAVWLSGYEAGLIVFLLFAVSPTFLGHSQNNLKDIPFALGFISSIYFIFRFLADNKGFPVKYSILLTLSMAFCISIRAGGFILWFFYAVFFISWYIIGFYMNGRSFLSGIWKKMLAAAIITFVAYFLSILLWPYALQDPLHNPINAYRVMLRFPATFRQIFEGKAQWSDYMPWYYLLKSMVITIPLIVISGLALFLLFFRRSMMADKRVYIIFLLFVLLFPLLVVCVKKPNLYSGWRHFLFLYPVIIVLASTGIINLFKAARPKYLKGLVILLFFVAAIDPASFVIRNPRYPYLYYNQITGGLKGALGNYETDYYFVSQRESAEWLIDYIHKNDTDRPVVIGENFLNSWFFRNEPSISCVYFRNEERSMFDWDYAIITNRYITPERLKSGEWPPVDALKVIYADDVPVSAVVSRKSKLDYRGYMALEQGNTQESIDCFREVLSIIRDDEMIFYNFAVALEKEGESELADSALLMSLKLNPEFEPALMYMGMRKGARGNYSDAVSYYKKLIAVNRKYFEAYVSLAEIVERDDVSEARSILRECLNVNPRYKPAIQALADSYRHTDPGVAEKYEELLMNIE